MTKGYFEYNEKATYVITDNNITSNWEYIYQNSRILLIVDQNGLVNAQINPPNGIMLFKRELNERFSKWLTYFKVNGKLYNNFGNPIKNDEKLKVKITFSPEKAEYRLEYTDFILTTEVFIASKSADIIV